MTSILIVENDFLLADDLQHVLVAAGYEVVGTAADFDAALEIGRSRKPQLALVDYKLQGNKDGIIVARHLRQLGTKIIYVTANANEVRLIDGMTQIVPKPFDEAELLRAVRRVLTSAERHD
jgi:DNA-binding response OmpR family regulator